MNLNSGFGKKLKAKAVVMEAKPLYDNKVPDWISSYLKKKKLSIDPQASALIAEYLGSNLSKVVNELDKLALNLPAGTQVTNALVEEHIGISKEYNVFELQKALAKRDVLKSNRIINYFASNPKSNPMPVVVGALYNFFSKVYVYHFVRKLPEKEVMEKMKLRSSFFLKDYQLAARNYPPTKVEDVIHHLKTYDLKSKGVDYNMVGKESDALLKEMVWHILH